MYRHGGIQEFRKMYVIQFYDTTMGKTNKTYTTLGFLILIALGIILTVFHEKFLIVDQDLSYHMSVAQSFVRDGGVNAWETWDSLPLGRPHEYPPVFHILLTPFVAAHVASLLAIQIFNTIGLFLLFVLSWVGIIKVFNARTGFFYLLLVTSFVPLVLSMGATLPASLVFALSPFLLLLSKKKKILACIALLTLLLYTHMIFPWLVVGAFLIWAWCNKEYFKQTLRVVGVSLLLYIPWLIHIVGNVQYLRYFHPTYTANVQSISSVSFNLSVLLICILCLVILARNWKKNLIQKDISFFVALLIVSLPIAYFEFARYANSIGLWTMMVIIAFSVSELGSLVDNGYRAKKLRISMIFLLGLSVITSVFINSSVHDFSLDLYHSIFVEALIRKDGESFTQWRTGHFNAKNEALAKNIGDNTSADAIIMSVANVLDRGYYEAYRIYVIPQLFTALSNRKMSNLRSPELYWQKGLDVRNADILLINRYQLASSSTLLGIESVDAAHGFELIGQGDSGLLIFKNARKQNFDLPQNKIVLPLWLAWILVFGSIIFVIYSVVTAVTPFSFKRRA